MGWGEDDNGALLTAAESEFDVLVTTDKKSPVSAKTCRTTLGRLDTPDNQLAAASGAARPAINALRSGDIVIPMRPSPLRAHPLHQGVRHLEIGIDVLHIVVLVQVLDQL
jgi:hypothetical protein